MWFLAPVPAVVSLLVAFMLSRKILAEAEGSAKMKEIAGYVQEGAMAYLKRQYRIVGIVFAIIAIILVFLAVKGVQTPFAPFLFLSGGFWSAMCGYLGMKTATRTSARTAAACQTSLNKGLKIAFRGGAVMGLSVVGFGLLDLSFWFFVMNFLFNHNIWGLSASIVAKLNLSSWDPALIHSIAFQKVKYAELTNALLAYAMGASGMALFARVGGGIFTKAADVGADLVGKVEAGIPEDDPRNPATIADNVGDNVGDVAGMGADLYESFCGSILAAIALGATLVLTQPNGEFNLNPIIMPMVVAGIGIVCSLIGIFCVKTKEEASQKNLLRSLLIGTGVSSVFILLSVFLFAAFGYLEWGIFGAVITGLVSGVLIGQTTEYYTSANYKPVQNIATYSKEGHATNILHGFSIGMLSAGLPVLTIVAAIILSFIFGGGMESVSKGIYGIAFAAIGMLSTLGIQLATDAFGPIADNAGGNAEMAGLPKEVRERTDALDSLGNTTAATGKGFAIGSAALTALALIAAYLDSIQQWLNKLSSQAIDGIHRIGRMGFASHVEQASSELHVFHIDALGIADYVQLFAINVINPKFIGGLFIGAMAVFVFCALTILAVGKAAGEMVKEVRRQFKEKPGILAGTETPEYGHCVEISTAGAQKAMLFPALLAIVFPLIVGYFLHVPGILGLLLGALTAGFSLAMTLNNSGGAWDNAKKFIESGALGGKGTSIHKAAVVGDTVGDPFKDTAGPSLNILIKLMTIVSIVFAGFILKFGLYF